MKCSYKQYVLGNSDFVILGTGNDYFDAKVRLVKYLTNNSALMKEILPVRDMNSAVNVSVKIYLRQITDVVSIGAGIIFYIWAGDL